MLFHPQESQILRSGNGHNANRVRSSYARAGVTLSAIRQRQRITRGGYTALFATVAARVRDLFAPVRSLRLVAESPRSRGVEV